VLRLTLLAHGATAANRAVAFPADEPLTPKARAAAGRLRGRFAPTEAVSGPALRARQTAEALGLAPHPDPALRDVDCGRWAAAAMDAVMQREPEAFAAFMTDPLARPHGGESIADLVRRTTAWLEAMASRRGRVLAITHAAVVRAALLGVLGAPLDAFWRIDVPPLSTTQLVSDGRRWTWRAAPAEGDPASGPRPAG